MTRIRLQMISLCAMLLLSTRAGAHRPKPCRDAAHLGAHEDSSHWTGDGSRCISENELRRREEKLQNRYNRVTSNQVEGMHTCDQLKESRDTCEQAVDDVLKGEKNETNLRSLSPWEYCIDRDVGRFPPDISIARCLCQGCVTDQSNNMDYNSVPVCGQMMVLWRKKCPQNPDKYVVRKYFISVPVGCTCVRPGYTSSHK